MNWGFKENLKLFEFIVGIVLIALKKRINAENHSLINDLTMSDSYFCLCNLNEWVNWWDNQKYTVQLRFSSV